VAVVSSKIGKIKVNSKLVVENASAQARMHTCMYVHMHTQMDKQVENIVPPALHSINGKGIKGF